MPKINRGIVLTTLLLSGATATAAQIPTPIPVERAVAARRDSLKDALGSDAVARSGTRVWFPVKSEDEAKVFWAKNGSQVLSAGTIMIEDRVFGAHLELFSDIVGLFRLGVGLTAAGAGGDDAEPLEEDTNDADAVVSRLANAGGIVTLIAYLPLAHKTNTDAHSTRAMMLSFGGGTEAPETGGFLEDPAVSGHIGIEAFYQRAGLNNLIDIELGAATRFYWFSKTYATKASLEETGAFVIAPRLGVVLLERTKLSVLWRVWRSDAFDDLGKLAVTLQQVTG
jgi:hypothetical protein